MAFICLGCHSRKMYGIKLICDQIPIPHSGKFFFKYNINPFCLLTHLNTNTIVRINILNGSSKLFQRFIRINIKS